jgi:hypothetical protein
MQFIENSKLKREEEEEEKGSLVVQLNTWWDVKRERLGVRSEEEDSRDNPPGLSQVHASLTFRVYSTRSTTIVTPKPPCSSLQSFAQSASTSSIFWH